MVYPEMNSLQEKKGKSKALCFKDAVGGDDSRESNIPHESLSEVQRTVKGFTSKRNGSRYGTSSQMFRLRF